jgi:hypothetical protein
VIVDNGRIQRFALDALNAIEDADEVSVFSCWNTRLAKRLGRHAAYYALNLVSVRNPLTAFVPLESGAKRIAATTEFGAEADGPWQRLPSDIIERLRPFDVILKFGMGLLRVPPQAELSVPILSYHHGDPDAYRGRPAGFWEMADGTPVMGQVVQVIGNTLDAGEVVAFAETKVFPWSYRATLIEAYRHSPLIINQAIRNAIAGSALAKARSGRNCRLPRNWTVVKVVARMAGSFLGRLAYGALQEKAWRVSIAPVRQIGEVLTGQRFATSSEWQTLNVARGYTFYADPFFCGEDAILVEALSRRTGLGDIVRIQGGSHHAVLKNDEHSSYPSTAQIGGRQVVVPETARWSGPAAYEPTRGALRLVTQMNIEGDPHVLDPTLIERDGRVYLFGNIREIGSNALYLWHSDALDSLFKLHPKCPILVSPGGSRMGGAIVATGGRLFRLGQDFSGAYGDGLFSFEIEELTPYCYRERLLGRIAFTDRKGPHTLNFRGEQMVFDWYVNRLTPLAAFRRVLARPRG